MFDLKGHKAIVHGLHLIVENRLVLFSDDENDMLYTGSNQYGNRILGTIVAEDDGAGFVRYIHLLLADKQYYNFLNKKTTLLELLHAVENFFIVDFDYNGNDINHAIVSLDDIPVEYHPRPESYCPNFVFESTLNYAASLKGRQSDFHKTLPEDLNSVNDNFSQFLKNATAFIYELRLQRTVYVEALQAGSFQINFRIEIGDSAQTSLFEVSDDKMKSFIKNFTNYIFNTLPNEKSDVFKNEQVLSDDFKKLETDLNSLFQQKSILPPAGGLEQKLIDLIRYSIEPLKSIQYQKSFNHVEFVNLSSDGSKIPIAIVDQDFIPSVETKLHKLEGEIKLPIVTIDDFPQVYQIQMYQFNKESGNGGAYIQLSEDKLDKILIHAKGKKNYANSDFTKSLDEEKIITINGHAKRIDGRITEITIQF